MDYEMQPLPLDGETADRLVAGRVAPEDAPPGYGPVVRLLEAASAELGAANLEQETEGVVAFALAVRSSESATSVSPRRVIMPFALSRARLVTVVVAAALAATAGLASAGSLPGAAQDIASEMLAKLGVSVPGPNDSAGTHPDVRGKSETASNRPSAESKGAEISELAKTTEATGVEKGAVVSTAASEGKSQAGQNGSASGAGNGSPPSTGPSGGGTGTADTASDGKSSQGTSTANVASGGNSAAGSANAASGQSNKP